MLTIDSIREIASGRQTSRLGGDSQNGGFMIRVLSPGAIHEGYIDEAQLKEAYAKDEEEIGQIHRLQKFTQKGDVIMKLSSPYEACLISGEDEKYLVPSNCCIIRQRFYSENDSKVPDEYICAAINSEFVRKQIDNKMRGSKNPTLRISDLKDIMIPSGKYMDKIGKLFMVSAENRKNRLRLIEDEEKIINILISASDTEEA